MEDFEEYMLVFILMDLSGWYVDVFVFMACTFHGKSEDFLSMCVDLQLSNYCG